MNIFVVILTILWLIISIVPAIILELSTLSYKKLNIWLLDIAISIDQLINVLGRHMWNKLFSKGGVHHFGNPDETVSSVLGKNKLSGTLTKFGQWIADNLNMFQKNHVENSIETDEK